MFGVSLVFFVFFSLSTRDGKLEVSRSIARTFLPTPRISLSLSFRLGRRLLRARARYSIDTYIDSIRCVRLILTNPLLSSPSSSSRAVLFFLGSPAVSPLSLSLFRRGELTLARRADIARRRSSIRSVFAAERKSSLFDTRIG